LQQGEANRDLTGKIEGSAEALWVGHIPISFPSKKNLVYKTLGEQDDKSIRSGENRKTYCVYRKVFGKGNTILIIRKII
jgi:hypothetical protein